jgi:hemerythrin-like metal-binding protein
MVPTVQVLFRWKPEYSVHHAGIDQQHQQLVALMNELHAAMTAGKGRTVLEKILTELVAYTRRHFAYEEEQMERAGYPSLRQHRELHRALTGQVEQYLRQWNAGQLTGGVELLSFLKDWLIKHILQTDRPLAAHLQRVA